MARVLLLIPTTSYRAADFLDAARGLGVDVVVGSDRKPVLAEVSGGGTLEVDLADRARGVARITALASEQPLDAVIGVDEETALLAAEAAAVLGLRHNPPEAVAATTDKYRFRLAIANSGLPAPRFRLVPLDGDASAAAREAAFPCVLKPLAMSASRGVIRADDEAGFVAAFERIRRIVEPSGGASPGGSSILVEDYIPGAEVSLEGLLRGGRLEVLALFDKPDPLEGPYFEETIYVTPSRLPGATREAVAGAVARAAAAAGLREGPVHAEVRLNERGPWVIEAAPRSIGGLCARALRFGAGISLEELILRHALGLPIETLERERSPVGIMMIPIPQAGVLGAVHGRGAALGVEGVGDIRITIPIGQPVVPLPEGNRYLGFIFARGATPEAVEASLREAHRLLEFDIRDIR